MGTTRQLWMKEPEPQGEKRRQAASFAKATACQGAPALQLFSGASGGAPAALGGPYPASVPLGNPVRASSWQRTEQRRMERLPKKRWSRRRDSNP
jgi:hypothetical protein